MTAPADEVLALGVPSATGIDGLLAPAPAAHAVLLVAHAWTHQPLGHVSDLIDVAAMLPADGRVEAAAFARRWGWERMWQATIAAADALLGDGASTPALRTWARYLAEVREPSVLETHIARITAPTVALAPSRAPRGVAFALRESLAPGPDDHWIGKLRRAAHAVLRPLERKSQHDRRLGKNPWGR
jgi:hypothetical protein